MTPPPMRRYLYLLLLALLPLMSLSAKGKKQAPASIIRVACVGNSVTYGYGLQDPATQSYPTQLQQLLGDKYEVRNFGHSGATLLSHGHRPYIKEPEFRQALDFKADLVVIHLGLNDTDPRNWPDHADEFIGDYRALVDSFRTANPNARIWVCLMTPIFHSHPRFQSGTRDWHAAIQKEIHKVATYNVGLIDLNTPLYNHPELFPDALHPNVEGAGIIARTVYGALTGDYGEMKPSAMYGNGMVVQRQRPIEFHGTCHAGSEIRVTFNDSTIATNANEQGQWSVTFPEMEAGGPYRLTFSTGVKPKRGKARLGLPPFHEIAFDSVYVGEVWLCSGQSNMEFTLNNTTTAQEDKKLFASLPSHLAYCDLSTLYPTDHVEWSEATLDSVNHLRLLHQPRWQACTPENVGRFSAIAVHLGRVLADSLRIPIGIICNAVGGTTTESWIDRHTLEWEFPNILYDWYHADYGQAWARGRALKNIAKAPNTKLQRHPYEPAYMFEAGILPLDHYQIKAVAWYQGESNANNIELHERLFRLLHKSWRNYFEGSPAFYYVQLSGLNRPSWPAFRDSQRRLIGPHSYMVVSHDCGDSLDVHYRNKRPIGERLAWQALRYSYGKRIISQGPKPIGAAIIDGKLTIGFSGIYDDNIGMHASSGDRIIGFEVAGPDGVFHPAEARVEERMVILTCPEVEDPIEVRYAWQPFTRANLVNKAGLPTSTFKIKVTKDYIPWIYD